MNFPDPILSPNTLPTAPRRSQIGAAAARASIFLALVAGGLAPYSFAQKNPQEWSRPDEKCPPTDETPIPDHDAPHSGNPNDPPDWLRKVFHWDDHNGNDLTLEIWCVRSSHSFSARVSVSKDGKSVVKASPGGENNTERVGPC
jgi:hypothetical protein